MPLTEFQRGVARLIAENRRLESLLAGGVVINWDDSALRISKDLDIFQDVLRSGRTAAEIVAAYAEADERSLKAAGYSVEWTIRKDELYRAEICCGADLIRLDWVTDSAYRIFPVQRDVDFGYCLHRADLAVNKVLALVGRSEIRDYLDILQFDQNYLSLGAFSGRPASRIRDIRPT